MGCNPPPNRGKSSCQPAARYRKKPSVAGGNFRAFQSIAAAQRGEVNAEVASAHPLSDEQVSTLEKKLRAREGRTIKLKTRVDPELLGGLVVRVGSRMFDSSLRTKLQRLQVAMKGVR